MPFTIDDQTYYEDINLTHEEFFEKQLNGAEIFTSQPVVGNVKELWDQILKIMMKSFIFQCLVD